MRSRYATLAAVAVTSLLLSGCAVLREFKPAVEVAAMTSGEYITLKRGDILTSGKLSATTLETIRVVDLYDGACAKPEAADCIDALLDAQGLAGEQRLSALSELWLHQAQTLLQTSPDTTQKAASDADDPRLNAWLEVARHAYQRQHGQVEEVGEGRHQLSALAFLAPRMWTNLSRL